MIFIFILSCLACFRLTRLITDDKIFDWLRAWVVEEAPKGLKAKAKQGISCPFCVSFYIALLITAYLRIFEMIPPLYGLLFWAAIWGGSILLNQLFVKLSD